jgi:hypothetical protein
VKTRLLLAVALLAISVQPDTTWGAKPDYLAQVHAYVDAMIEHGRDTFGETKSPLLLISIDPQTMTIPDVGSPRGLIVARLPNSFRHCANPHLDQNLYQIMYALSEITGDREYAREADKTLGHFLNHCQEPRWGFFCWGEHFAWDIQTDASLKSDRDLPHEFQRPWILWERSFQLAPDNCKRFADCLWDHQIRHLPDGTISFSRHAMVNSKQTPSRTGSEYPRHGGFYIATWAEAYRQTGDRRMLDAIRALVKFFESRRHPDSGAIPAERHARSKGELMWPQSNLSLAVDLWDAAAKIPTDLAQQMRSSARQIDENFLRIPHEPGPNGRGFVKAAVTSTLEPGDVRAIEEGHDHGGRWHPWSRAWETGYGVPTDGRIAMLCYLRYRQVPATAGLKELVIRSADRYLVSNPPSMDNLVAGALGDVIANLIAAHRLTKDEKYVRRAEHFADVAGEVFLSDGPLPKTTGKAADYCAASRCDTLMMQLLDLHLIRNRPETHVKLVYTDR